MFLRTSVTHIARAILSPSPSHARLRFTNLRFHSVSFVSLEKAEDVAGARRQKLRITTPGKIIAKHISADVGIFSWST